MRKILAYLDKKAEPTELIIYENFQEFEASGLPLKNPRYAERMDYFRTNDDYYLPVLSHTILPYNTKHEFHTWYMPLAITFNNLLYVNQEDDSKSRFRKKYHRYTETIKPAKAKKRKMYLNSNERLCAEYIARGIDIYDAFNMAFPTTKKSIFVTDQFVTKALRKPGFVEYILESMNMDKLKKALADKEVHDKVADSILRLLSAEKQDGSIDLAAVKFGLGSYVNIMTTPDQPKGDNSMIEEADFKTLENEMKAKFELTD